MTKTDTEYHGVIFNVVLDMRHHGNSVGSTNDLIEAWTHDEAEAKAIAAWGELAPELTFHPLLTTTVAVDRPHVHGEGDVVRHVDESPTLAFKMTVRARTWRVVETDGVKRAYPTYVIEGNGEECGDVLCTRDLVAVQS